MKADWITELFAERGRWGVVLLISWSHPKDHNTELTKELNYSGSALPPATPSIRLNKV
jgi:hypothetical protein